MMNDDSAVLRLPAEWEQQDGILLAWPHEDTDWAYMIDEVTTCFTEIVKTIAEEEKVVVAAPDVELPRRCLEDAGVDMDNVILVTVPTNDTWARDFGPISLIGEDTVSFCDFKFNAWGLKFAADKDNLITRRLFEKGVIRGGYCNCLGFVLEGGSIESDGAGTLLTTSECLLSPNRNGEMSKEDIESYLIDRFNLKKVLWLDYGYLAGDDTDSHVDTLARLAPDNTIIYVGCDDASDEHYESLQTMKRQLMEMTTPCGDRFNLVELPMPDAVYDEDGLRLPATYANFLITNRSVLMPSYGQPKKDFLASQILKIAFPDREIKPIDCRALIKQHGSLHCVTMQLPENTLPI